MSEAPKRIWTSEDQLWWDSIVPGEPTDGLTEYVRADIVIAVQKALKVAAQTFRSYEKHHFDKQAFEKADRNMGCAELMEAALKLLEDE